MKKTILLLIAVSLFISSIASADIFGTGANQFGVEFVTISGDAGNLGAWSAGRGYTFTGVNHDDYRMGKFEVTNEQWSKFKNSLGVSVTGSPSSAYNENPSWAGLNLPTNNVSPYEAAQFVNWLNVSNGYQAAYKFMGTQGANDYTWSVWDVTETDGSNLFRNKDAHYFLPTEDEWVKAAYWNGTSLQTYATKAGESIYQGDGSNGGWNFYHNGYATNPGGPWEAGSGSEELNGTFDMMGNVWEFMESPYSAGNYLVNSSRSSRGGSYYSTPLDISAIRSSYRTSSSSDVEDIIFGFRVASVPEPTTLSLLAIGAMLAGRRRRN